MNRIVLLAASLFVLAACSSDDAVPAAREGIDRVEPPFWWTGFEHRELQLLVRAGGIADYTPSVSAGGITVSRFEPGDSENYLFVYLDVGPSAEPGTFDIVFEKDDERIAYAYELRERIPGHVGTYDSSDVIYLITPDRFANGDPANDSVEGYVDELDRDDDYGRHGGDIEGMRQHLDYIAGMGFTQLWINPLLENAQENASYHGYATTDYYKVDPRFGSNESYRQFVAEAREQGVGVIMDLIVNHAGSGHWWMDDLPTETWLNIPDTRARSTHARTTNQDPYASEFDKGEHADGWFDTTMPDLNQRDPLLADYLIQNAIWWTEYLGLSGIRQDTYPYPDKHFMAEWTRRIMQEYPDYNIVGEEWSPSPAVVSYWQRGKQNHDGYVSYLPGVFDFPLQIALQRVLTSDEPPWGSIWTPVYEMLGHDFLYPDPMNLVIMPDNHDMSRVFTYLDEDEDLWRMAMVFYATMRGIPQFYYGTEILMSHPGTDSHGAIREEFPGGWPDHDNNAFTGDGLSSAERDAQDLTRKLLQWRKQADVIHTGKLMQFTPVGNVYAYFRYDDDDTIMVIFNLGTDDTDIDAARFAERLQGATRATNVLDGSELDIAREIELEPRSVLLLDIHKN
ncbi:MAG: glycoside hydrolase family 13 protein [Woeseiaceae bacterium]|nr:glycoside hydrolase family 13 protein [Woeseiaceae bacterium]